MLIGTRIRLRHMEPGDAEALWRRNSDPDVMRRLHDGWYDTIIMGLLESDPRD